MPGPTIYDVGLHRCEDTELYLAMGHRVVAVDASPGMIAAAGSRFARQIAAGQLVLVHAAIAERPGEVTFWLNEHTTEWSSLDIAIASRLDQPHRAITVPARTLADVVAQHGPAEYIKIDIEGADLAAVRSLDREAAPRFISCEIAPEESEPLLAAMSALGFSRFLLLAQNDFSVVEEADLARHAGPEPGNWEIGGRRARMRRAIRPLAQRSRGALRLWPRRIVHAHGSSGPWGHLLPDRWRDERGMRAVLAPLAAQRRDRNAFLGWWYDLHATR